MWVAEMGDEDRQGIRAETERSPYTRDSRIIPRTFAAPRLIIVARISGGGEKVVGPLRDSAWYLGQIISSTERG